MGLAGLTAVFGMGTGGAPPVSSPESGRGAVRPLGRGGWSGAGHSTARSCGWVVAIHPGRGPRTGRGRRMVIELGPARIGVLRRWWRGPVGVVKPLGC